VTGGGPDEQHPGRPGSASWRDGLWKTRSAAPEPATLEGGGTALFYDLTTDIDKMVIEIAPTD
jgi:hypothetical protein